MKMNILRNGLVGLLVLQLVLAIVLLLISNLRQSGRDAEPLLVFEQAQLNRMVIYADNNPLTLLKQGDGWFLSTPEGLPVDQSRLDQALRSLSKLKAGWPVASTSSSHQRFEVSEEKYQRRIQLYRDKELMGDLFLGSSPSFKKVHARLTEDNKVYALSLNNYDFPTTPDGWLDKKYREFGLL